MDNLDDLDLPDNPTIEGLTKLIGEEALAQLAVDFGGSMLSIPRHPGEHNAIAYSIGLTLARRLGEVWGGMNFEVPLRVGRELRIQRMLREGIPVNAIARRVGVSRRYIYSVRDRAAQNDQLDLFPTPHPM